MCPTPPFVTPVVSNLGLVSLAELAFTIRWHLATTSSSMGLYQMGDRQEDVFLQETHWRTACACPGSRLAVEGLIQPP